MSCFVNQTKRPVPQPTKDCSCCSADNNGIVKILNTIWEAQRVAAYQEEREEFCDRTILGPCCDAPLCNTRPIRLYTCGGDPIVMDYELEDGTVGSTFVFRIEKLDGCTATFRALAPNPDTTSLCPYIKTNTFFSINMGCCCHMLRCLEDTHVECL